MIKISRGGHIHFTFANGVTTSIFIGAGAYRTGRPELSGNIADTIAAYTASDVESPDAEVAAWDDQKQWITSECPIEGFEHDVVQGYVNPDRLVEFLAWCAAYKAAPCVTP